MNTDELRAALDESARQQPPTSPGLRAGVDRQVRRQRVRTAILALPAVVVVVLAIAFVATRPPVETDLATAGQASAADGPAVSSDPSEPQPDGNEGGAAPTGTGGACGSVAIDLQSSEIGDYAPVSCFLRGFNADVLTDLTVEVAGADGSRLTQHLSSAPGHQLTIAANGSLTIKLPAVSLGGGEGGVVSGENGIEVRDCGTITLTSTGSAPGEPDPRDDVATCLLDRLIGGEGARVQVIVNGSVSGSITGTVELTADHRLTLTLDGTAVSTMPHDLTTPAQILEALPTGSVGLSRMIPGFGQTPKN